MKPLGIDLFAGVGGWTDGLLAEDYDVIGFDIERHVYGEHRYPAQLVIQDVLTLHGSQFREAALIVASPPCQFFSYTAMPWTRAKDLAKEVRACPERTAKELALFNACFRIQREASEAAGRHIPMVVENVRGAQGWVGRGRWNFGSFYLWGDVPALMPPITARKNTGGSWFAIGGPGQKVTKKNPDGRNADAIPLTDGRNREQTGFKSHGMNWSDQTRRGQDFTRIAGAQAAEHEGVKHHGSGEVWFDTGPASLPSSSPRRKAASAMIAKIPLPLARHIARVYRPEVEIGLFGSL